MAADEVFLQATIQNAIHGMSDCKRAIFNQGEKMYYFKSLKYTVNVANMK